MLKVRRNILGNKYCDNCSNELEYEHYILVEGANQRLRYCQFCVRQIIKEAERLQAKEVG